MPKRDVELASHSCGRYAPLSPCRTESAVGAPGTTVTTPMQVGSDHRPPQPNPPMSSAGTAIEYRVLCSDTAPMVLTGAMDYSGTPDAGSAGITPRQVALVQSSFEHVLPIAEVAGMLFYERIFTLAPEARALFGDDIALQASRTMASLYGGPA